MSEDYRAVATCLSLLQHRLVPGDTLALRYRPTTIGSFAITLVLALSHHPPLPHLPVGIPLRGVATLDRKTINRRFHDRPNLDRRMKTARNPHC